MGKPRPERDCANEARFTFTASQKLEEIEREIADYMYASVNGGSIMYSNKACGWIVHPHYKDDITRRLTILYAIREDYMNVAGPIPRSPLFGTPPLAMVKASAQGAQMRGF
jgi:hypothetical protein